MPRYIKGQDRSQTTLSPESLDQYVTEDNPVRVVDVFIDEMDLSTIGFKMISAVIGPPRISSLMMLELHIYGYLNRIQSSRRLECKEGRNVELMWLLGRLYP